MPNRKENIIDSCKSIIDFLVNENDAEVRKLKYQDFKHKFVELENLKNYKIKTVKVYDVIIFTVVKAEFQVLDELLDLKKTGKIVDNNFNNIRCWEVNVDRNNFFNSLKCLVVFLGEAGDINCSIACMRVFQYCDCDLAILCGIAAGYEPEIKKYSVVISNGVVDYEPQRIENDGTIVYRPDNYDLNNRINRDATFLETEDAEWRKYFLTTVNGRKDIDENEFDKSQLTKSELKTGVIASGRKLLADQATIANLRKQLTFKKGVIAAEMEGGGFCPACKEFDNNWLVIRGISDYGSSDKNDKINKKYQFVAATAAITAMLFYLRNIYRRENEPGGDMETF